MQTICLKCNKALTIRDVIQNTCSKCTPPVRSGNSGGRLLPSTSEIKTRFDALILEELKKRAFEPAA
jgi:hypothetical protein